MAPLQLPTERLMAQLCLWHHSHTTEGFPGGANGKEPTCQCKRHKRHEFNSWMGKIPWSRKWKPTPASLPVKFHGQRRATVHGVIKSWTQLSTTPHAIGIVRFLLSLSFSFFFFFLFKFAVICYSKQRKPKRTKLGYQRQQFFLLDLKYKSKYGYTMIILEVVVMQ